MPGKVMSSTSAVLTMSQAVSAPCSALVATRPGALRGTASGAVVCAHRLDDIKRADALITPAGNQRFWCILLPHPTTEVSVHFLCQGLSRLRESPNAQRWCEQIQCMHSQTAHCAGDRGGPRRQPSPTRTTRFSVPRDARDQQPTLRGWLFFRRCMAIDESGNERWNSDLLNELEDQFPSAWNVVFESRNMVMKKSNKSMHYMH